MTEGIQKKDLEEIIYNINTARANSIRAIESLIEVMNKEEDLIREATKSIVRITLMLEKIIKNE